MPADNYTLKQISADFRAALSDTDRRDKSAIEDNRRRLVRLHERRHEIESKPGFHPDRMRDLGNELDTVIREIGTLDAWLDVPEKAEAARHRLAALSVAELLDVLSALKRGGLLRV